MGDLCNSGRRFCGIPLGKQGLELEFQEVEVEMEMEMVDDDGSQICVEVATEPSIFFEFLMLSVSKNQFQNTLEWMIETLSKMRK